MPIVIQELVITATVDANLAPAAPAESTPPEQLQQQLVQACVEQVLAVLRERAER